MDMYLTDGKGTRLTFPVLPDRVSVKTGAISQNFQIISVGEIKIPRGTSLTGYSWNGIFPAADSQEMVTSFGRTWQKPDDLVAQIEKWIAGNDTVRLLITETSVNADVFIEAFNYDYFGTGHISYTINLSIRPVLTITTAPAPTTPATTPGTSGKVTYGIVTLSSGTLNVRKKPSTTATIIDKYANGKRIEILGSTGNWYITPHKKGTDGKGYVYKSYVKLETAGSSTTPSSSSSGSKPSSSKPTSTPSTTPSSSGYQTKKGDTIYALAKKYGVNWYDLWNLNSAKILKAGGSLSNVPPGISLQIPAKKKTTTTSTVAAAAVAGAVSGATSLLKKAATAVKTVVSKVATAAKTLVTTTPTAKKVTVSSTAASKIVTAAKTTVSTIASKLKSVLKLK